MGETTLLDAVFRAAPDGILVSDANGRIVAANSESAKTFGYDTDELVGMEVEALIPQDRRDSHRKHRERFMRSPRSRRMGDGRLKAVRRDGTTFDVEIGLNATDVDGERRVITVIRDVSDRVRQEEHLRYLSTHDALTDLYNRAYFEEEKARLERSRRVPISVIVLDMDGLKAVNDERGHAAGDGHLKRLAVVLRQSFRGDDVVARTGGDEFCVLLPSTDAQARETAARRLLDELGRHNEIYRGPAIAVSIGAATAKTGAALTSAIRIADERMYAAKRRGRGRRVSVV